MVSRHPHEFLARNWSPGASSVKDGELWYELFDRPYFQVRSCSPPARFWLVVIGFCRIVDDAEGAELMGTLKNIVALGAGFIDGLGLGNNSKAAIIRIGMQEMIQVTAMFFMSQFA